MTPHLTEPKIWGSCAHCYFSSSLQVDLLLIAAGGYSSIHFHERKHNLFLLIAGKMEVEEFSVAEWCPTPDGSGPPEQVHLAFRVKGIEARLVIRFKSPRSIGRLIASLVKHRNNVWPPT